MQPAVFTIKYVALETRLETEKFSQSGVKHPTENLGQAQRFYLPSPSVPSQFWV